MIKNRISKYFRPAVESHEEQEPPKVNPAAFIAIPTGLAPGSPLPGSLPGSMPTTPMNIYEIALAEAQRKIAEARANEMDDLSGWLGEGL
jgi:hypothetical protein